MGDMTIPLQFDSLIGQGVFVWSECLSDWVAATLCLWVEVARALSGACGLGLDTTPVLASWVPPTLLRPGPAVPSAALVAEC